MHLERLSLQSDTAVALAVVGGNLPPCRRTALRIRRTEHVAIPRYKVQRVPLLVKLFICLVHFV